MRNLMTLVCLLLTTVEAATAAPPNPGWAAPVMSLRQPDRVVKPIDWKHPPPTVRMQGVWTNEKREPGSLFRLVVHGNRLMAIVRGAEGDLPLGEVIVQGYVGGPDSASSLDANRLVGIFQTDSAQIEVTLTLVKPGILEVDQMVHFPTHSAAVDRWARYVFTGGLPKAMAKAMSRSPIPEFPWPPPLASVRATVPDSLAVRPGEIETCGTIFDRLIQAARNAGFHGPAVYAIPGDSGFVVVTQLENIRPDGRPLADRWVATPRPDRPTSIMEFLAALVEAPPGLYRVIVLAITNGVVTESEQPPTRDQTNLWLHQGAGVLPESMRARPLPGAHCEALVYEFRRPESGQGEPSLYTDNLTAYQHLAGAGLWREELP